MRCRSICASCIARGCYGAGRRATGLVTGCTTPRPRGRSSCWREAQKSAGDRGNRPATADRRRRRVRLAGDIAEREGELLDRDGDAVVAAWARRTCSPLLSSTSSGLSLRSRRSVLSCRSRASAVWLVRLWLCVCSFVGAVSIAGRSSRPGRCWAPGLPWASCCSGSCAADRPAPRARARSRDRSPVPCWSASGSRRVVLVARRSRPRLRGVALGGGARGR